MKAGASVTRQLWTAMAALSVVTILISTAAFYIVYVLLERWRIVAPLPPGTDAFTGLDVSITLAVCVLGLPWRWAVQCGWRGGSCGPSARSARRHEGSRAETSPPA